MTTVELGRISLERDPLERDPLMSGRQESPGPARWWVGFAEAAERSHQFGEAGPAKATEPAVFEPADNRLIHAAEMLELSLRDDELMPPSAHELADQFEPAHGQRVHVPDGERVPGHIRSMAGAHYLTVIEASPCVAAAEDFLFSMQLGCIKEPPLLPAARPARRCAARAASPRAAPVMHPSYIGAGMSRRPGRARAVPTRATSPRSGRVA